MSLRSGVKLQGYVNEKLHTSCGHCDYISNIISFEWHCIFSLNKDCESFSQGQIVKCPEASDGRTISSPYPTVSLVI